MTNKHRDTDWPEHTKEQLRAANKRLAKRDEDGWPSKVEKVWDELRPLHVELDRLRKLAEQANVNCRNTVDYLRKYRPDLASVCSGWCDAIDAAMKEQAK